MSQEHKENIQPTLAESAYPLTMPSDIFSGRKKEKKRGFHCVGKDLRVQVGGDKKAAKQ